MPRQKQYQWSSQNEEPQEQAPSRSQRKRESSALQQLGQELTKLPASALSALPLTSSLRAAVETWKTLPSHEAKRRQLQFIGRLMREEADADALKNALSALQENESNAAFRFRGLESAREKLIAAAPDERAALCLACGVPEARLQNVLKLAADAKNERDNGRPPRAFRALFRLLRDIAAENELPKACSGEKE